MTMLIGVVVNSHQCSQLLSIYLSNVLILRQLCSLQESHSIYVDNAQTAALHQIRMYSDIACLPDHSMHVNSAAAIPHMYSCCF